MHMRSFAMFAAALLLGAGLTGTLIQAQEAKGDEKKVEEPAKAAPTVYIVGIDGAT